MIQSDEFIFFRGVGQPPISLSTMLDHAPKFCFCTEQQTKKHHKRVGVVVFLFFWFCAMLLLICFVKFVPCTIAFLAPKNVIAIWLMAQESQLLSLLTWSKPTLVDLLQQWLFFRRWSLSTMAFFRLR